MIPAVALPENVAATPAGKFVAAPMPVAPTVEMVIAGEIAAFKQAVVAEGAPNVGPPPKVMVDVADPEQPQAFVAVSV
jgi:hypothetical protein